MASPLLFLFLVAFINSGFGAEDGHPKWGYNAHHGELGPDHWSELFPEFCAGERQSPIDIKDATYDKTLDGIDLLVPMDIPHGQAFKLTNNGHSLTVSFPNVSMHATGGGLKDMYKVAQFHFHWGDKDDKGSEHTVKGLKYALEMHIVMYDSELYSDLTAAVLSGKGEAIAVLGVFFQASSTKNPVLDAILNTATENIKNPGASLKFPGLDIRQLLSPDTHKYYRYEGSLTTPPCNPVVVWTVFAKPNFVSHAQLEILRKLNEADNIPLVNNFRPPQPLKRRHVRRSFADEPIYTVPPTGHASVALANSLLLTVACLRVLLN